MLLLTDLIDGLMICKALPVMDYQKKQEKIAISKSQCLTKSGSR